MANTPGQRTVDAMGAGMAGIAASATVPEVYRLACALAARLPRVSGAAILRQDSHGLHTVAYDPQDVPIPTGLLAQAAMALHHRWIGSHAVGAPEHGPGPFTLDGPPCLMILPLVCGDVLFGGLVLTGHNGQAPTGSQAERMSVTGLGVVVAQALDRLLARQRMEFSVSQAVEQSYVEATRRELGRELHDGPAHDLTLISMSLDRLNLTGLDAAATNELAQIRELAERGISGMRASIGKLRAPQPKTLGITGPLRELVNEFSPDTPPVAVDFAEVHGVRLAPEVERVIVGIVREALHNVRKHAQADSVRLEVHRRDDAVEVAVIDDGIGFAGDAPDGHFGLEQIRELAEETGGEIEVGSRPGHGTTIRARIPAIPYSCATTPERDPSNESPTPFRLAVEHSGRGRPLAIAVGQDR
ncbi:MAG: sensor histidine kinase [Chloroflexota bacterium]|nr:sensor histidine kinase [Chloroflexota bacterium]